MKIHRHPDSLNRELDLRSGEYVVFTNGVFDLIHPGHIELLEFARSQGDILVVGINNDDSVRRLKGENRPVFPLDERMEILAAVRWVDYVIPFGEDTPMRLICELPRITVLIKGGDYRPEEVVGRSEVESRGGRLIIFPLNTSYSTTKIIQKIVKK